MKAFDENGNLMQNAADVLFELGNVGAATAVMPIGNLREMKIKVERPVLIKVNDDLFSEITYDPEQIVIGVATKLNKTFSGTVLFLLGREFIRNTIAELTGERYEDDALLTNEDSLSAIHEIINYMTAGYAKVISSYLSVPVYISCVSVGLEKVRTLVHTVMNESDEKIKRIACVDTGFTIVDENGRNTNESGQVLIFPDEELIERFLQMVETER